MLRWQRGRCAICRKPPGARRLDRDHDHVTGKLRGLLCTRCNRFVIGRHRAQTGGRLLVAAGEYLLHPPAKDAGLELDMGKGPVRKRRRRGTVARRNP